MHKKYKTLTLQSCKYAVFLYFMWGESFQVIGSEHGARGLTLC